MAIVIEATFEDGVLKPSEPLPLEEHEKVQLTIQSAVSRVRASYGLVGWKGDPKIIERIALEDEFGIMESP